MTTNLDRYTVVMNKMYSCNMRVTLDNSFLLTNVSVFIAILASCAKTIWFGD